MGHSFNRVNNQLDIELFDQVDLSSSQVIKAQFDDLISGDMASVSIHAKNLKYIDSSGVAVLLAIKRRCAQLGASMKISEISQEGFRVLQLAKLEALLPIEQITDVAHSAVKENFDFPADFMQPRASDTQVPDDSAGHASDLNDLTPGSFL